MTLAELIAEVEECRGSQFGADKLTGWVNEVENKVVEQIINRAKGNDVTFTPYKYEADVETILMVPDTHKDLYETYIYAKIDYINNEIDAYNADAAMHAAAWDDYAAEYRRGHFPKQ